MQFHNTASLTTTTITQKKIHVVACTMIKCFFFLTAADTLTIWPPQRADFLLRFFFAALSDDDDASSAGLAFGSFGPEVVFDSGGAV